MSVMGAQMLPAVALEETPVWRQCLRGFSQCAFQCNEITGVAFIAGGGRLRLADGSVLRHLRHPRDARGPAARR